MGIACSLRGNDAIRENAPGFVHAAELAQEIAALEISGDIGGMILQQLAEMGEGILVIAQTRAFQGKTVASEGISGLGGQKGFEFFAARTGSWAHGGKAGIITPKRELPNGRGGLATLKKVEKHDNRGRGRVGKPVRASRSEMTEVVLPNDANVLGYMLGGRLMHLMDIAAAMAAHRHSNSNVVTASVDYLEFRNPIKVGDFVVLKSSVNRVFQSSMEVGVKVFSENVLTGERRHTSSAYLTFVALDQHYEPHTVPPLILETAEDRRRFRDAGGRRKIRLAHRNRRVRNSKN